MKTKELQAKIDRVLSEMLDALPTEGEQDDGSDVSLEGLTTVVNTISALVHVRGELMGQNDVTEEPT